MEISIQITNLVSRVSHAKGWKYSWKTVLYNATKPLSQCGSDMDSRLFGKALRDIPNNGWRGESVVGS